MPIPTQFDHDVTAVDDAASSVLLQLRTMKRAGAKDLPRLRVALRDHLKGYVDTVMTLADEACE